MNWRGKMAETLIFLGGGKTSRPLSYGLGGAYVG
nr:MAG TPA: hypothetical protein [Caudoviricetes sp.]